MKPEAILILGAGGGQKDAIEYCKNRGIKVGGVSYTTTDVAIPLLDFFENVDIKDADGVAEVARKYNVGAIYSIASDLAIPTAMKASEVLGLPHFISGETADACHSKHLMRQTLGGDFEGNIDFIVCSTLEEALGYNKFPAMMKPVDSQGQRGCYRVGSKEDINAHFQESLDYSVEGKVIIEKFIDGPEISVNGYMCDGKLRFAAVSDRIVFEDLPGGIIRKHCIPSIVSEEIQKAAIDLTARVCAKLGVNNGPCYCQIKIDEDETPVILEIAPRLDGCHMWNLIEHYCGFNLLDACFRHLFGEEITFPTEISPAGDSWELEFISEKPYVPFDRSKYDVKGADFLCWYYEQGEPVGKVNGHMEKCGYTIRRIG